MRDFDHFKAELHKHQQKLEESNERFKAEYRKDQRKRDARNQQRDEDAKTGAPLSHAARNRKRAAPANFGSIRA